MTEHTVASTIIITIIIITHQHTPHSLHTIITHHLSSLPLLLLLPSITLFFHYFHIHYQAFIIIFHYYYTLFSYITCHITYYAINIIVTT
jgi:hypothetical protein